MTLWNNVEVCEQASLCLQFTILLLCLHGRDVFQPLSQSQVTEERNTDRRPDFI